MTTNTHLNPREMKIITVEDKEINYRLAAKVIYSGNGRYGHYKVSRRKN